MKILTIVLILFLSSCAHHHNKLEHHHHEYDKQCAYSIAHGQVDIKGKDEFKIDHAGKMYYFSDQKKLDLFIKDLDANIEKANQEWQRYRFRSNE